MPNAVLAAVVFLIGVRLIDYLGMSDILRLRKGEFAVAAVTTLTVVVVGIEQGIILAIALSIVEHVYHSYKPSDHLLSLGPDGLPRAMPVGIRHRARPRAGHLPVRSKPVLRQHGAVHRGGRRASPRTRARRCAGWRSQGR